MRGLAAKNTSFNGAALLVARKVSIDSLRAAIDDMLQWGRAFGSAEGIDSSTAGAATTSFNGAALLVARKGCFATSETSKGKASMGPRFW